MSYRETSKRKLANKKWSEQANAKQARTWDESENPYQIKKVDKSIFIIIERPGTISSL